MGQRARRYRNKPFAVFEHGTRIYAPCPSEDCFRVTTTDAGGRRLSYKLAREDDARAKARELEAFLASRTPIYGGRAGDRTVGVLASLYVEHLAGRSVRYRERQDQLLRCWILPRLRDTGIAEWTPAMSEEVLARARQRLSPQSVQGIGSCMRSLVTFAHKSRWLPRQVDPMWSVSYSAKAEFQGQAPGFVARDTLPSDDECAALFEALVALGEPAWGLAMRLAHRSGVRWGELIALRPRDIHFEPHRLVDVVRAVEQSGKERRIKTTKNTQKRTSIFPASLTDVLAAHVEQVRRRSGDDGLLFAMPDGSLAERRYFLRRWLRAASLAGWTMHTPTRAQWHPHDLRHVAACWMLFDVRIDPAMASRMLGHANPAFTLSRYVGVRSGADAATNALTDGW